MSARLLLDRLVELTEQELAAAKRIDGAAVKALSVERANLLFELQVAVIEAPQDVPALAPAARNLLALEERLQRVTGLVLDGIRPFATAPAAPTYGRSGRLFER